MSNLRSARDYQARLVRAYARKYAAALNDNRHSDADIYADDLFNASREWAALDKRVRR